MAPLLGPRCGLPPPKDELGTLGSGRTVVLNGAGGRDGIAEVGAAGLGIGNADNAGSALLAGGGGLGVLVTARVVEGEAAAGGVCGLSTGAFGCGNTGAAGSLNNSFLGVGGFRGAAFGGIFATALGMVGDWFSFGRWRLGATGGSSRLGKATGSLAAFTGGLILRLGFAGILGLGVWTGRTGFCAGRVFRAETLIRPEVVLGLGTAFWVLMAAPLPSSSTRYPPALGGERWGVATNSKKTSVRRAAESIDSRNARRRYFISSNNGYDDRLRASLPDKVHDFGDTPMQRIFIGAKHHDTARVFGQSALETLLQGGVIHYPPLPEGLTFCVHSHTGQTLRGGLAGYRSGQLHRESTFRGDKGGGDHEEQH